MSRLKIKSNLAAVRDAQKKARAPEQPARYQNKMKKTITMDRI